MNRASVDYVRTIRESIGELPDGYKILNEGVEIGKGIKAVRAFFLKKADMSPIWPTKRTAPIKEKLHGKYFWDWRLLKSR